MYDLTTVRAAVSTLQDPRSVSSLTPEEALAAIDFALGHLSVCIQHLPPEEASKAAETILRWASGERLGFPAQPKDRSNREIMARALIAFEWEPVWDSLPLDSRPTTAELLLDHIRRGPEDPAKIVTTKTESLFFSALLAARKQHVFRTYPRESQRKISEIFYRYATYDEQELRNRLFLYLSGEHLFRHLTMPHRKRIAAWLLDQARTLDHRLGIALDRLSCRRVFNVLSTDERADAARLFMRYASQESRLESSRPMVRVRTDPAAFSLVALAKGHVFASLSSTDRKRCADLMLRYSREDLTLDPIWPDRDESRERGIKRGLDGLRREWVFHELRDGDKQQAIDTFLHYAERGPSRMSSEDPTRIIFEDTRLGFAGRARRALARPFVQRVMSAEDMTRLKALGIRLAR